MLFKPTGYEYVTTLALGPSVTGLVDGGTVQLVQPLWTLKDAIINAVRLADSVGSEIIKYRLVIHGGVHQYQHGQITIGGLGLALNGSYYSNSTAANDWSPATGRFQGIVIDGCGAAYPALTQAEVGTDSDGAGYCFKIARIARCQVFASEDEQAFKPDGGGKYEMTPWHGVVWCFNPNGTRFLVQGHPTHPYPP